MNKSNFTLIPSGSAATRFVPSSREKNKGKRRKKNANPFLHVLSAKPTTPRPIKSTQKYVPRSIPHFGRLLEWGRKGNILLAIEPFPRCYSREGYRKRKKEKYKVLSLACDQANVQHQPTKKNFSTPTTNGVYLPCFFAFDFFKSHHSFAILYLRTFCYCFYRNAIASTPYPYLTYLSSLSHIQIHTPVQATARALNPS